MQPIRLSHPSASTLGRLLVGALRGLPALSGAALLLATQASHAVPSFARQTGADCAACHVGAFGPQLTPYGNRFKMGGYVDSDGKEGRVPLSGMVVANLTRTATGASEALPGFKTNNNVAMQEASLFVAGKIANSLGAFAQITYSGVEKKTVLDQFDIRYARTFSMADKDLLVGLSLNGNPTLTDPLNTLGQWRFPYISSDFGHGMGHAPLVEGLGGAVVGLNAYALWDQHVYAELGLYNTLAAKSLKLLGGGDAGRFKGPGTYWRLAYLSDQKRDFYSVGLLGFSAALQPDRSQLGVADRFRDLGVDASYQWLGNRQHIFTVSGSIINERRRLDFSEPGVSERLKTTNVAATYHFDQTWGGAVSVFDSRGIADTRGTTLQADWTPWGKEASWRAPWANVRLGLQYTAYAKYDGGTSYVDDTGATRRARDNNTTHLFVWTSF